MNRKLTQQERNWLLKGLRTLSRGTYFGGGKWVDMKTGKVKPKDKPIDNKKYLRQIDDLRVVKKCSCGEKNCHTVNFQHYRDGYHGGHSVALAESTTDDGRMLIVFADRKTGKLTELELI